MPEKIHQTHPPQPIRHQALKARTLGETAPTPLSTPHCLPLSFHQVFPYNEKFDNRFHDWYRGPLAYDLSILFALLASIRPLLCRHSAAGR
jgi:hypothetical protein